MSAPAGQTTRRALLTMVPALAAVVTAGCASSTPQLSGQMVFTGQCSVCHSLSARAPAPSLTR